jgi:NADPH:quinone reductase-like Zn-dependent oxidoreductase
MDLMTFNDFAIVQVIKKPKHMSDEEASSLLYTGLTAWCALKVAGGLYVLNASGKNVLVLGGSGGVGNCAIQILKSWGAKVM